MDMYDERNVLCASSAYEKKYYFNDEFGALPKAVQQELQIMCVLFTEEVGGILTLRFDEEGSLLLETQADEGDLLYDDIGCGLMIKKIQTEKSELLRNLELYYKVFFLGEDA
jgi:hypothetical protein